MKIAFFHHTLRLGSGIDTVITELASRLARTDEVTVFCFKNGYDPMDYDFKIEEIKSIWTSSQNRMSVFAPFLLDKFGYLKSKLRKFDIVNTHIFPASYLVRNLDGPLNVVTEWSTGDSNMWKSSLKQRIYVKFLVGPGNKIAAKRADVLLASSYFIKNWVNKNYSLDPIVMHLDGINFTLLDKNKKLKLSVYNKFPQLINKKIILFVGRITDHKNIHSLIFAFELLITKYPNCVLLLVGDYNNYLSYFKYLKGLLIEKNLTEKVIFTGVVPWEELPEYYSICSVYATCTMWEGFLRPEAFAYEKPIVCFNTGPNSESVINTKTGFLINNFNIHEFAEKLYLLLTNEDLALKMGKNGYFWAKNNLDFDIITENFRNLCISKIHQKK